VVRRRPRYAVVTARAGIDDVHQNVGSPIYLVTDQALNAGGAAVADVDNDGFEDILLSGSPDTVLYRNRGDGTFENVTAKVGIPTPYPEPATGVVFFDYDNDGWPDLYIGAAESGDRLFHNVRGVFEDVTERSGIPRGRWTSMPIVADYDRDGFLDVYLVRMGDHAKRPPKPNYDAHNGVPHTLLRNRGDGTFEDVTRRAHAGNTGWGLAGAWGDSDGDGWPDLYLANEFGTNTLLRNRGDGTFEDVTEWAGAGDPGAGMGVAWGDYDGDGDFDIFVSNMYSNSAWAIMHPAYRAPTPWWVRVLNLVMPGQVRQHTLAIIDGLSRGSTLLENDGHGRFTDVSERAGVRDTQWGWAADFLDYDNDGRLDLYATNGFYTGVQPDDV
jgi:VCBS repeat protein